MYSARAPRTSRHFYPRPPRGGRLGQAVVLAELNGFLSTPSARRATREQLGHVKIGNDFYPRPPRGGRHDRADDTVCRHKFLSTPSARRATGNDGPVQRYLQISIHALREEGDLRRPMGLTFLPKFLSTPSARRATPGSCPPGWCCCHFYPRPPRGGRPVPEMPCSLSARFLSTPSARRATAEHKLTERDLKISIHALREEGDPDHQDAVLRRDNFYPRPPRGGRLTSFMVKMAESGISIHALREEGDTLRRCGSSLASRFLSTPSARRATPRPPRPLRRRSISIHALREEGD